MKYTDEEKATVLTLLERDWTYDQILAVKDFQHFDRGTLRAMKSNAAKAKNAVKGDLQRNAKPKSNALQRNTDAPKPKPETAKNPLKTLFLLKNVSSYEVAYYTAVGISAVGIVTALQIVGSAVALVHVLVARAALQRCKRASATLDDLGAVVFSGLAVGVPSDIVWANKAVWENVANLPLRLQPTFGGGSWSGADIEMPFYIACYIAAFLWVSSISTAWLTQRASKE